MSDITAANCGCERTVDVTMDVTADAIMDAMETDCLISGAETETVAAFWILILLACQKQ